MKLTIFAHGVNVSSHCNMQGFEGNSRRRSAASPFGYWYWGRVFTALPQDLKYRLAILFIYPFSDRGVAAIAGSKHRPVAR